MNSKHTTHAGCSVTIEQAGTCVGIRIVQPSGKVDQFTCNREDLIIIAGKLDRMARNPLRSE